MVVTAQLENPHPQIGIFLYFIQYEQPCKSQITLSFDKKKRACEFQDQINYIIILKRTGPSLPDLALIYLLHNSGHSNRYIRN